MVDAMALDPIDPTDLDPAAAAQMAMFDMMIDQMPDEALDVLIAHLSAKRSDRAG